MAPANVGEGVNGIWQTWPHALYAYLGSFQDNSKKCLGTTQTQSNTNGRDALCKVSRGVLRFRTQPTLATNYFGAGNPSIDLAPGTGRHWRLKGWTLLALEPGQKRGFKAANKETAHVEVFFFVSHETGPNPGVERS